MTFRLPQLYPITDTKLSGLSHAEQVARMIAGGARFIQLREKYATPADFYREAKEAVEIAHAQGVKVIINDRVDIALALKAAGVHLGQDDMPPAAARRLLGDNAIIGFSTHNIEQVSAAVSLPLDYIAFGPIFPTRTKKDPDPVVGLDALVLIRKRLGDFPLAAIGGIDEANFRDVLQAGADSAAVLSALLSSPDLITERVKLFNTNN
jgi:thiamine-phosphate pyrophosphorylase